MCWAIPPLPYTFMVWCSVKKQSTGTTLTEITLNYNHKLRRSYKFRFLRCQFCN